MDEMTTQTGLADLQRIRDLEKAVATLQRENRDLRRNNKLFVTNSTEHLSLVDHDYVYRAVNDAYLAAHIRNREEIVGHGVVELLGRDKFEKRIKARLDKCLAGRGVRYQEWFQFAGIGRRFMDVVYSPVFEADGAVSGVVVNSRDITELEEARQQLVAAKSNLEQRVAERTHALAETNTRLEEEITKHCRDKEALRQSEEMFRYLFYAIPDPLFISRLRDGLIRDANDGFFQFTGYSRDEVIGKSILSLGLWADSADRRRMLALLEQHAFVRNLEAGIRRRDGRPATVHMSAVVITLQGEVHILSLAHDISLRKEMEQNLRLARQRVEEASRAKSAFLANISHELRTPLNTIIGFAEIIKDGMTGPVSDDQRGFLSDILESSQRLLRMFTDILELALFEGGSRVLELAECDLEGFLDAWLEPFRKRAIEDGIDLYLEIDPRLGAITTDPQLVGKIVRELLENAFKFTPSGGSVRIAASRVNEELRVTVWDTGIGMTEEQVERLFQPFEQGNLSSNKEHRGTGLGLALCKRFSSILNGRILVESTIGKGSRFVFIIPDMAGSQTTHLEGQCTNGNNQEYSHSRYEHRGSISW